MLEYESRHNIYFFYIMKILNTRHKYKQLKWELKKFNWLLYNGKFSATHLINLNIKTLMPYMDTL